MLTYTCGYLQILTTGNAIVILLDDFNWRPALIDVTHVIVTDLAPTSVMTVKPSRRLRDEDERSRRQQEHTASTSLGKCVVFPFRSYHLIGAKSYGGAMCDRGSAAAVEFANSSRFHVPPHVVVNERT